MFILFSAFAITFTALIKAALATVGVSMAIALFLAIALAFAWALICSTLVPAKAR